MQNEGENDVTRALKQASQGNRAALDALLPIVYEQLRVVAAGLMRKERVDHTLQATALVGEAYVKLVGQRNLDYQDRNEFFAAASNIIRRILVDHARTKGRGKRPPASARVGLEVADQGDGGSQVDLMILNDAMEKLSQQSERAARVVEMRYFGGLTMGEIAKVLGVSLSSVNGDWAFARAWLAREMAGGSKAE